MHVRILFSLELRMGVQLCVCRFAWLAESRPFPPGFVVVVVVAWLPSFFCSMHFFTSAAEENDSARAGHGCVSTT